MPIGTTAEVRLEEEEARVEGLDGTGSDMSRVIGMSDAVFAFSMTFLVITLVLPQLSGGRPTEGLGMYFAQVWPSFVAYLISFFVITSWWSAHRRIFSPIIRYDTLLTRLNNLFLLIIAVTPFLVAILYDYGPGDTLGPGTISNEVAVAFFAAIEAFGGLILLAIWRHSTRDHRLVEERLPASWIRRTELGAFSNIVVFAVSIPVAFVLPFVAMLMWIFMATGLRHIRRANDPARRRSVPSTYPDPEGSSLR